MPDPHITRLANVMVHYSTALQPGQQVVIRTHPLADDLTLAVGAGYPESGSKNELGIHWDMLCDLNDAKIQVDGDLFYRNGKPVV